MRLLLQPRVLSQASPAALLSAAACYPRLSLWTTRAGPIWYLEAIIFICGIVLWSFVFAWHTACTKRPVFLFKIEAKTFALATVIGVAGAGIVRWRLDPLLRPAMPSEYPGDMKQWLASLLFSLALTQLFLVLAPFDLLVRTFRNLRLAAVLTALFGAFVLALKINTLTTPIPAMLVAILLAGRAIMAYLAVSFYLRGGVILAWWLVFLFQARQLPDLFGQH
jgi:hypothetical protein